jgi:hypothetical protein
MSVDIPQVKSLTEMIAKLRSGVQLLMSENVALKPQLCDLHQAHACVIHMKRVISSTAEHNVAAKRYREVLTLTGGNHFHCSIIRTQPAAFTT